MVPCFRRDDIEKSGAVAPLFHWGGELPKLSLRANGSRECAPDDRLREAIHRTNTTAMDCFVADGSSQ
jgi:hypothetical protein